MMKKTMNRRSFLKQILTGIFAASGTAVSGRLYAEFIEPKWTDIIHHTISDPLIPKGFSGITIAQFSDTHLGFQYSLDDLKKTIDLLNETIPEIVIFTGDLMDKPNEYSQAEDTIKILKEIKAPLGKFAVFGNHDHGGNGTSFYQDIMEKSGFTLLKNKNIAIPLGNGDVIHIAGIDEPMLGTPDWKDTMHAIPADGFNILLSHAPDLADRTREYPISLQLSGHSHGGQIQIPLLGPFITPPFAQKYTEGLYEIGSMMLYVNRGLGTTRLPLRFLSRPELTYFTLAAKESQAGETFTLSDDNRM